LPEEADKDTEGAKQMIRRVEKGQTLVVDGPACVSITTGKAGVFGSVLGSTARVVIREGKRLPFAVQEKAEFEISLGEEASAEVVEENTIPPSWVKSHEELSKIQAKPATAMVLGAVDSGKTSFCTYLVNKSLGDKRRVAVLDGDVGQSDIGPPSTVGYAIATKPITDLFNLHAKNAFFVGETSPSGVTHKVLMGLTSLKKEIQEGEPESLIINTDGWIEGEYAVNYKVQLAKKLTPDVIFCIQQKDELTPLINALKDFNKVNVESPSAIRPRNPESRRSLRELAYTKYLRNAKVQSLLLSWTRIEGNEFFDICKTRINSEQAGRICVLLGMRPLYISGSDNRICVVIGRRRRIDEENVKKAEEIMKKKFVVIRKGGEEGLLAGIYNVEHKFLGVGVLQEIDYLRKTVKISTPITEDIGVLVLGKLKLDKNMREIPTPSEKTSIDFASFKTLF
jgi:polynucleotide 5'-hydroxyl-kinase GRC3/NOL9